VTTALEILNAGFSRSTANDRISLATDAEVLAHVNRRFQGYFALLAAAAPEAYLSRQSLALGATSPVSLTLPTDIIRLEHVELAGVPVGIVPVGQKGRGWHKAPSLYRAGRELVSLGRAGDPTAGQTLTLWILDAPATLATTGTALDARWPVRHNSILELDVALYLASKDEGRSDGEVQRLTQERAVDLQMFYTLNNIGTKTDTPAQKDG